MENYNISKRVQRIIELAKEEAKCYKTYQVDDSILLFHAFKENNYVTLGEILIKANFNLFTLRFYLDKMNSYVDGEHEELFELKQEVELSSEAIKTLAIADSYRQQNEDEEINETHLLLALLESNNKVIERYFTDYDIQVNDIKHNCIEYMVTGEVRALKPINSNESTVVINSKSMPKIIAETCTDLTAQALAGEIDPIIGRTEEIENIINTMARRTKNNVLVVGASGIGKSALVRGLALKLANNEVPSLSNKRIFSLSLGSLMNNTKYRGELESKITDLLKSLSQLKDIILFIDEFHMLMKSTSNSDNGNGGSDMANLFKTEMSNRKIQIIGCTTEKEVRAIQEDPAFMRRMNIIKLNEPNEKDAIEIMKGLNHKYEEFHNIIIPDDTIKASVKFAKRYIAERHLPDSSIDLIDSAAAKLKLSVNTIQNNKVNDIKKELYKIDEEIDNSVSTLVKIDLYKQYKRLNDSLLELNNEELSSIEKPVLTPEDVATEVEFRTKIPVSKLMASDKTKLLTLEEDMHKMIVGQDIAIQEIANAIRRNSAGLSNPNKPIASFLFAGSSGVGKTAVAKAIADLRFGSRDNIIRIDCSEYSEQHSISKLIGAPPGYVNSNDGGQLTEAVRHKPYSVILFDEMEKARGNLNNILLQILDEGHLTDSHGVRVSFKNCIIILTSNIGSSLMERNTRSVGFGSTNKEEQDKNEYEQLKEFTLDAIKNTLPPEFIGRLSATVVFHRLNKEQQRDIVRLMGKDIDARLAEQDIVATCTDAALDFITDKYYSQEYNNIMFVCVA